MQQVDQRKHQLKNWLKTQLQTDSFDFEAASSDASFRRYFRVTVGDKSYIAMDAPPALEDCVPFVEIAEFLRQHHINAPYIHFKDFQQGFLLLSDLGSKDYLDYLNPKSVPKMYANALDSLHKMHKADLPELPKYDHELLFREMQLFNEWFLENLLKVEFSAEDRQELHEIQTALCVSALEQPTVFVHRDYHSRNLMLTELENPGVIDFQDAVIGPITYDLVSLLRDCYIDWPEEQIYQWLDSFMDKRRSEGCQDDFNKAQFYKWFDLMGAQRHMKAIGIFSRLLMRDGKNGYLKDIPRTLGYLLAMAARHKELASLAVMIEKYDVQGRFNKVLQASPAESVS